MVETISISSTRPNIAALVGAGIVSCIIVACAAVAIPYGHVQWPANQGFLPAFAGVAFLVEFLTAVLLFSQARVASQPATAVLASTYLFSGVTIIPHMMAFPGVFAAQPIIGQSASAIWLWCFWHTGFAVGVILYTLAEGTLAPRKVLIWQNVLITLVVVGALTVVATAGLSHLPVLLIGGSYKGLITTGIGPVILSLTVVAFALTALRLRLKSTVALWLTVALLAATTDITLSLLGGSRFSVGWYCSRVLSLVTGVTVLVALLSELMRLSAMVAAGNVRLETLLLTDVLTGQANRRGFDAAFDIEWRRAFREGTALSVIMIDIDFFKRYNDTYGHPAGDICIRRVGQVLGSGIRRPADFCARIGGEEFAILLPSTDAQGAVNLARHLRDALSNLQIPHAASDHGRVTLSIGVATGYPSQAEDPAMLIERADHALYAAKSDGRDAVREAPALLDELSISLSA